MKKIAIHQPNYIPWPGYFYKIFQSDYFVFLDDVQYSNEGMHNYHYIKTAKGPSRLKVPVIQTLGDKISEVLIRNELNWKERHLNSLKANYILAENFNEIYDDFLTVISYNYNHLAEMNIGIILFLCNKLGIKSEFLRSSELGIKSRREQRIIDICLKVGCEVYLSGKGAGVYQNEEDFLSKGIKLEYLEYRPFEYRQQFTGFQPNVTILDYLMNCGYNWNMVIEKQAISKND